MKRLIVFFAIVIPALSTLPCESQTTVFSAWETRVRSTSAQQPGWAVPVITSSSGIVQLVRPELAHQYTPTHCLTVNYGNSKGFNFIPYYKTEIDVNLPPYIVHNNPKVRDGAGDFSMLAKYRPFSGNEKHGNYSTAFQLLWSMPTGSYKNGAAHSAFTPTFVAGKGVGIFDVQSSIGALLPTDSVNATGRTILWNTVAQCKLARIFWPEVAVNSSFYHLGPHDGKNQTFVTPGLMVSKIKLRHDAKDRLALVFGGGMQIATSHYHSYNHSLVLTSRITF